MKFGVIFDMDGVLVDSSRAHFQAWNELGRCHGVPFDEALFGRTFGMHNGQIIPIWLEREPDPEELNRLADQKEERFRELVQGELEPLPGARELVEGLHAAGVPLAVGSSGPRPNVELILHGLRLRACFDALITGDDVHHGKPHPEVFQKAVAALGLPAEHCVVVEDAPQGVEAGLAAGCRVLAVTSTRPAGQLAGADLVVASLGEVNPARLEGLAGLPVRNVRR